MAKFILNVFLIFIWVLQIAFSEVISITQENLKENYEKYDMILFEFYADWCSFSSLLMPIMEDLSNRIPTAFPDARIAIAKIDCETQGELARANKISKYPTLKLAKYGEMTNKEYRGQRSVEAFIEYLRTENQPRVTVHESEESIPIMTAERSIIGLFETIDFSSADYSNFYRVSHLTTDCDFHAAPANVNSSVIYFQKKSNPESKIICSSDIISSREGFAEWASTFCTPIVRQLTFSNAEELTEIGLPLLILFYHPNDVDIPSRFTAYMEQNFADFSKRFTFIYADGVAFSHPLMHLGKFIKDLPLLCIDSFQHMFLYQHNIIEDLESGDRTRILQFMNDLASGKLHRHFHGQTESPDEVDSDKPIETTPLDSVFKKLAPAHNRYSLLHEEL